MVTGLKANNAERSDFTEESVHLSFSAVLYPKLVHGTVSLSANC